MILFRPDIFLNVPCDSPYNSYLLAFESSNLNLKKDWNL